ARDWSRAGSRRGSTRPTCTRPPSRCPRSSVRSPRRRMSRTFLAARETEAADAVVVGVPVDGGVSFRPGAAQGPSGIREFSESIESYSPRSKRDLEDVELADGGDVDDPSSVRVAD